MGMVFLARDTGSGGEAAVKLLKPEFARDARIVRRFVAEARRLRDLSHPNLARVLESVDRAEGPYFVMPYFERGSLAGALKQGTPAERELILGVASQIAGALQFIHSKGLIHGDLKPGNVLLATDGQACLADFGLARTFNDPLVDVTREHCEGTPPYMSPAVAQGEVEDTRCDIYGFGALLYELLAGQPPYRGETTGEIRQKVKVGPPGRIIKLNPKADAGLVLIAEGAMAREHRDRYADMRDVQADLELVRQGKQPRGPHGQMHRFRLPSPWPNWVPERFRKPALGLVVVAMVVCGLSLWLQPRLTLVSSFSSPKHVQRWDKVLLGDWNGDGKRELYVTATNEFLVFNRRGELFDYRTASPAGAEAFQINAVAKVEGTRADAAILSWTEGDSLTLKIFDQHQIAKTFTFSCKGRRPDQRNKDFRIVTSRLIAQKLVDVPQGKVKRVLLAFLQTNYGGSPRGLYCFDFETGSLVWSHLTGPTLAGLEVMDPNGDGGREFIFGSNSPDNGNRAPDGTDDAHAYVFAVSSEGKLLWTNRLPGAPASALPVILRSEGGGRQELLAWAQTAESAHERNAPEVGLLVKLNPWNGEVVRTRKVGACLLSCLAADLDGSGKQAVLCTDCQGNIHVLNPDLTFRKSVMVVRPNASNRVELRLVAVETLSAGARPRVVLRCSCFERGRRSGDGVPKDPTDTLVRREDSIFVLNSRLKRLASYAVGRDLPADKFWDVKVGDLEGDGRSEILSLTDHVEVLRLTR